MPRFQKRVNCDTGYSDGQIFVPLGTGNVTVGTGAAIDRIAAGNVALSLPTAATAYTLNRTLESIFRTGLQDDLQEQFGGGQTSQVFTSANGLASPPAGFSTPASVSGAPPYTGLTQFTPVTASRPKGIQINTVTTIYEITGAAATTNTIALYSTAFANAVAPAVTTILSPTNQALTVASTPHVVTTTLSSPAYLTAQNSSVSVEWNLTTGATSGAALVWGVILGVTYNYN